MPSPISIVNFLKETLVTGGCKNTIHSPRFINISSMKCFASLKAIRWSVITETSKNMQESLHHLFSCSLSWLLYRYGCMYKTLCDTPIFIADRKTLWTMGFYPAIFLLVLLSWTAQQIQCHQRETKKASGLCVQPPWKIKASCVAIECRNRRPEEPYRLLGWTKSEFLQAYKKCDVEFKLNMEKITCHHGWAGFPRGWAEQETENSG